MWVPVNSYFEPTGHDVFAEAANTVMNPTRATPIMSDDAVPALRVPHRVAGRKLAAEPTQAQR